MNWLLHLSKWFLKALYHRVCVLNLILKVWKPAQSIARIRLILATSSLLLSLDLDVLQLAFQDVQARRESGFDWLDSLISCPAHMLSLSCNLRGRIQSESLHAFSDFFDGLGNVAVSRRRYPWLFYLGLKSNFSCVYQSVHVLIQSPISKLLELDPVVIAAWPSTIAFSLNFWHQLRHSLFVAFI